MAGRAAPDRGPQRSRRGGARLHSGTAQGGERLWTRVAAAVEGPGSGDLPGDVGPRPARSLATEGRRGLQGAAGPLRAGARSLPERRPRHRRDPARWQGVQAAGVSGWRRDQDAPGGVSGGGGGPAQLVSGGVGRWSCRHPLLPADPPRPHVDAHVGGGAHRDPDPRTRRPPGGDPGAHRSAGVRGAPAATHHRRPAGVCDDHRVWLGAVRTLGGA